MFNVDLTVTPIQKTLKTVQIQSEDNRTPRLHNSFIKTQKILLNFTKFASNFEIDCKVVKCMASITVK